MKKRIVLVLCMIMLLIMSMALTVACDTKDKEPIDDGGNNGGDNTNGDNSGGLPSDGIVDISQHLTYELNEDGNSYAVTGLTEQGYKLAVDEDLAGVFCKCQGKYKLSIPDSYHGKPVTSIKGVDIETMEKPSAFYMCNLLVEVRLPNIISIGDYAFYFCTSLTNITIPNSVASIGEQAFANCMSLTNITIPNGLTSIGKGAFAACDSLTSITIPNSVTSIGEGAFEYCHRLIEIYNRSFLNIVAGSEDYGQVGYYAKNVYTQVGGNKLRTDANGYQIYTDGADKLLVGYTGKDTDLTLPSGITEIYRYAFYLCNLISITIPDSVTNIGEGAFTYCMSLTSITIPNGVTSIENRAFSGCSSLTTINIPNSVTSIGEGAFSFCSSLKSITIPKSVTSIVDSAFNGCSSLTTINIPNSVTSIGGGAFWCCSSLTSITIPNSVTSIEYGAFYNCSSLNSIIFQGTQDEWNAISKSDYWDNGTGDYTVTCTDGNNGGGNLPSAQIVDISQHLTYELKEDGNSYAVTGLTEEGYDLARDEKLFESFSKGQGKYKLSIPASHLDKPVTSIKGVNRETSGEGPTAFYMCTLIAEVRLPDTITSIGDGAFAACASLTSITIPNNVTSIGEGAFFECYRLIEVYNKSSLNIVAGSSDYGEVASYAKNVYTEEGGSKLSTDVNGYVIYTDSTDKILVKYTGNDTNLTLPSDITEINQGAFLYCSSLTSITIPNGVTSIGDYAFLGCSSLTSITIPNSVTSIGEAAISYCSNLTNITIPDSVTNIGDYAFIVCRDLENIVFHGTKEQWNAISKGTYWDEETGNYTIHCTDGDIAKG